MKKSKYVIYYYDIWKDKNFDLCYVTSYKNNIKKIVNEENELLRLKHKRRELLSFIEDIITYGKVVSITENIINYLIKAGQKDKYIYDIEYVKGKIYLIDFEDVYIDLEVYLNKYNVFYNSTDKAKKDYNDILKYKIICEELVNLLKEYYYLNKNDSLRYKIKYKLLKE